MRIIENVKYGEHSEQVLDIYIPDKEEFPVLVYLHGGGLEGGSRKREFIPDLVDKGVAVVSADYRMYPTAVYPQFIDDGAFVVAWAKENMGKYGKVTSLFVGGSSAGAYITQMLCFNKEYLQKYNITNADISGYYHDAGQPTVHFNVLRERGVNTKTVVIDEMAPLYYISEDEKYPPMEIVVSDNDIPNRYEQTMLLMSTLKIFGHDMSKIAVNVRKNSNHCQYKHITGEDGKYIFANMVYDFINNIMK